MFLVRLLSPLAWTERSLASFKELASTLTPADTLVLLLNLKRMVIAESRGQPLLAEAARSLDWIASASRGDDGAGKGAPERFNILSLVVPCEDDNIDGIDGGGNSATKTGSVGEAQALAEKVAAMSTCFVPLRYAQKSTLLSDAGGAGDTYDLAGEVALKSAVNCFSSGCNILNGKV